MTAELELECTSCGASTIACETRRWLGGRRCCDHCSHEQVAKTWQQYDDWISDSQRRRTGRPDDA